jgi:hypothetical protein
MQSNCITKQGAVVVHQPMSELSSFTTCFLSLQWVLVKVLMRGTVKLAYRSV